MLLKNATWLTPRGELMTGTITIRGGIIERLSEMPPIDVHVGTVVDSLGLLVLPGLIDPHVHLREQGEEYKEGIANGSLAAAVGGVTTLLDMPNNRPPCSSDELLREKKELFRAKSLTNWGLHVEAVSHRPPVSNTAIASAKVYMAKSSLNPPIHDREALAWIFRRYGRVTVHAEDETLFLPSVKSTNDPHDTPLASGSALHHHVVRPRQAVRSALAKIQEAYESLIPENRPRLVLCHIATIEELQWVSSMKNRGYEIYAETCPHYWTFTEHDYLERGTVLKVNPPLRTADDRQAVVEALTAGDIDFVSTDHAPHTRTEKADPQNPPSGVAGIEWLMPLLLQLVDEGVVGWQRFAQLGCENAARCYDIIGRDGVRVGNAADLVLVEKAPFRRTQSLPIITRAAINPYDSALFGYRVFATIVNGSIVQQNGAIINRGAGQEVYQ